MSARVVLRTVLREHVAAYVLASLADILLLAVLFQLAPRAGVQFDLVGLVVPHEFLLAILMAGVVLSGIVKRGWRLQYVATSILFSGFVGYRLAARFVAALELVGHLGTSGVAVSDYLGFFYVLALGSAVCYVVMILVLRKGYGKLAGVKNRQELAEAPSAS